MAVTIAESINAWDNAGRNQYAESHEDIDESALLQRCGLGITDFLLGIRAVVAGVLLDVGRVQREVASKGGGKQCRVAISRSGCDLHDWNPLVA